MPAPATKSEAAYFSWEDLQLTPAVLANLTHLNVTDISLFNFPAATSAPSSPGCKVFPGDANWPSPTAWEIFNLLTGGALIQTVPLAAPCYPDWPEYNATECAYITANWADPHLQ